MSTRERERQKRTLGFFKSVFCVQFTKRMKKNWQKKLYTFLVLGFHVLCWIFANNFYFCCIQFFIFHHDFVINYTSISIHCKSYFFLFLMKFTNTTIKKMLNSKLSSRLSHLLRPFWFFVWNESNWKEKKKKRRKRRSSSVAVTKRHCVWISRKIYVCRISYKKSFLFDCRLLGIKHVHFFMPNSFHSISIQIAYTWHFANFIKKNCIFS